MSDHTAASPPETVVQRVRRILNAVRPAERKVLETLVSDYPMSGLVPVVQLAAKADVSTATVLRVVGKLGYSGYASFQSDLRSEVAARLFSPADADAAAANGSEPARRSSLEMAQHAFIGAVRSTFAYLDEQHLDQVVSVLADVRRPVFILGGHFSSFLADYLTVYLTIIRPQVRSVGLGARDRATALLDVGAKTTVVVFDYRRYQGTTLDWAAAAKEKSAKLILVTDQYLSPISSYADHVLVCDARGSGRFDSLVSGHVLVEVIVAHVFERLNASARLRLKTFEAFRLHDGDSVRQ